MKSSGRVAIIGAGFSGLSLAWALSKKNVEVEVFESSGRPGGLISSTQKDILVETAANAILLNPSVEELLRDLNLSFLKAGFKSKKRWIFRKSARQLPLNFFEILVGLKNLIRNGFKTLPHESISDWGSRILSPSFVRYLIAPGLQGVYGTQASQLSAQLVLGGPRSRSKGSISFEGGMQTLTDSLEKKIKELGVKVHLNKPVRPEDLLQNFSAVVLATSIGDATESLKVLAPRTANQLGSITKLPLVSVSLGFSSPRKIKGFGCLFPEDQNFESLGVLFNSDIFSGRGPLESETWILGKNLNEEDALGAALKDRLKLTGLSEKPDFISVTSWPTALPLYGFALQNFLEAGLIQNGRVTESNFALFLTGNYLGSLGLAKILNYNIRLAETITKELQ